VKDIEKVYTLWEASEATHPGKVRQQNQDSTLSQPDQCIWAVPDGISGHASGELASRADVERLDKLPLSGDLSARTDSVVAALNAANSELIEQADTRGKGLCGSTVVSLINHLDYIAIIWVGDSRAYRQRRGELVQLMGDHSQAEELIEPCLLSRRDGQDHLTSNISTQAIGADISLN
jgi:serine/threonine protein phosphatase PrpC